MNKKKIIKTSFLLSFMFAGALTLSVSIPSLNESVQAKELYGCSPDSDRISEVDTSAKFDNYLKLADVKQSIYVTKAGKTLSLNRDIAINRCLIVYGTPADVVTEGRKVNKIGDNGEWLFLGYNENGIQYNNPEYPDIQGGIDYIKTRNFIKEPWNNDNLKANIASSPTKPYALEPGTVTPSYVDPAEDKPKSPEDELNRAYDRFYWENCGTDCSLGKRGYFPQVNTALGVSLVGTNLKDYASVQLFPDNYAAGVFNLYQSVKMNDGTYYYFATLYLPPYKLFLQENRDLSIKINNITPSSVYEGSSYTVNYTVCNLGQIAVENPVINYGPDSSQSKSKVINTTIDEQECYTGNISEVAPSVSSDTNKTYYMTVNKDDSNPAKESDRTNNTATKAFKILKKSVDGSVTIVSHTPTYPHSNEPVEVTYKVCNEGNYEFRNAILNYGFTGKTTSSRTIGLLAAGDCVTYTSTHTTPEVKDYTGPTTFKANLKLDNDSNLSNNSDSKTITVRNPDMAVKVIVDNDSSDNTIGTVKVKVSNKMFTQTKENCGVTGSVSCYNPDGTSPGKFRIDVFDTKFTDDPSDDTHIMGIDPDFMPKFTLNQGEDYYFTIDRSKFLTYIKNKYPNTYQSVQFRVVAQLAHYTGEVDWEGNPMYTNNKDEGMLNYFPSRPNVGTFTECSSVNHSITNYFVTSDGVGPIKICAGHYPTYPSTTVESGMQAYHYALYRFFPEPIPKYTVATPETSVKNPNHFSQIFKLPTTEDADKFGDFDSMFIPNKTSNGYYQERGRYMPTGGTFNFEVYKKNKDNSKGQTIALGTVSYNIPSTCYSNSALDINHQYGCDEVLFFLPNSDTGSKKYAKPDSYTKSKVSYPITDTKIPYLNPGKYTFEFKATENFRYFYQKNLIQNGYKWSNPMFR